MFFFQRIVLKESDLDVFVDTGRMYDGMFYQDEESQATLVRQVTKELRKNPDFDDVNPIPNARTPIVQVFHKITKLDCDLSFRHGLSVENTDFLRYDDPRKALASTVMSFVLQIVHRRSAGRAAVDSDHKVLGASVLFR